MMEGEREGEKYNKFHCTVSSSFFLVLCFSISFLTVSAYRCGRRKRGRERERKGERNKGGREGERKQGWKGERRGKKERERDRERQQVIR